MPWFLSGYYHWKEPHVVAHIDRYSICQVKRLPGSPWFYSVYDWPNGWIGISLDPSNQPLRWHVTMTCHIHPLMFDHVQWRYILSISPDRFDTGLLTEVHIPDIDFRAVHFRGPYVKWAAP